MRAANRTARHNVYAYRLREGNRERYSDDGEPAKTAGTPALEVLQHSGLTDLIVVVTRYFGGVLLGTGGLVRAYTTATLYLPWRSYTDEPEDPLTGITQTDWLPVQLGRLALPASLCSVTTWEQLPDTVQYSEAAAAALALRACRAALLAEFPDAVIEAEQREISAQEGTETAAVTYIFTANIAAPP